MRKEIKITPNGLFDYFLYQLREKSPTNLPEECLVYSSHVLDFLSKSKNHDFFDQERKPKMLTLGIQYLVGLSEQSRFQRLLILRRIGDLCLFKCGYEREQISSRTIPYSYYVDLGKRSYLQCSSLDSKMKQTFLSMSESFEVTSEVIARVFLKDDPRQGTK